MEFRYVVGQNEQSFIDFYHDKFTGSVKIFVNGYQMVTDNVISMAVQLQKTYTVPCGHQEQHIVQITLERPVFLSGMRDWKYHIYVDSMFQTTYVG